MPLRSHEDIHLFYRRLPVYHPQMWQGKPQHSRGIDGGREGKKTTNYGAYRHDPDDPRAGNTEKYPRSVLHFPKSWPAQHPTEKPVSLLAYLIRTYSDPGDLVLDNTAGIGSLGLAAIQGGRRALLIERQADYCAQAAARLGNFCRLIT
jgi:DNA modification methylase